MHRHHDRRRAPRYGFAHLLVDFTLTILTGGLWLIWIAIRFMRSNSR